MSYCPTHRYRNRAFTMVEMAIVMVIIGLLVGGVLGGKHLLKNSEMQTVVSDLSKYTSAVAQFRQQYGGFPGDMLDATSFWGDDTDATLGCSDGDATTNGTPGTCNGNSDNNMSTIDTNDCKSGTTTVPCEEPYRAWQHLVLANYIQGSFSGRGGGLAAGDGSTAATLGTNVPKSRIQGAGWSFSYKGATSNATYYDARLDNYLAFGAANGTPVTEGAALTPTEAYNLDKKVDDGKPGTGRVLTLKPAALTDCAASATDYAVTISAATCSLMLSLSPK